MRRIWTGTTGDCKDLRLADGTLERSLTPNASMRLRIPWQKMNQLRRVAWRLMALSSLTVMGSQSLRLYQTLRVASYSEWHEEIICLIWHEIYGDFTSMRNAVLHARTLQYLLCVPEHPVQQRSYRAPSEAAAGHVASLLLVTGHVGAPNAALPAAATAHAVRDSLLLTFPALGGVSTSITPVSL